MIQKPNAFTLVELLVVVAIIALLMAVLLPALTKAKDAAKITLCTANMRQISLVWTMYANDNGNHFPFGDLDNSGLPDWSFANYDLELFLDPYTNSNANAITSSSKLWICPSSPLIRRTNNLGYTRTDGQWHNWTINSYYGLYNHWNALQGTVRGLAGYPVTGCESPWRMQFFTMPAALPIQFCSLRNTLENTFIGWHYPGPRPTAFLDGHAKMLDTELYKGNTNALFNATDTGHAMRSSKTCGDFALSEN